MIAGGGKTKGAAFERRVCVHLSLWLSQGRHEDLFWRSSMSGGRSTLAALKGKRLAAQAGDVTAIHPIGAVLTDRFFIECKCYRDLCFEGLMLKRGKLAEFWLETRRQAARYGKLPMLIAKQNRQPAIVCLSKEAQVAFSLTSHLLVPSMGFRAVLFEYFLANAKPLQAPS